MATLGKTELVTQLRGSGRWPSSAWAEGQGWILRGCLDDADCYQHPKTRAWLVIAADSVDLRHTTFPLEAEPGWWRMIPNWKVSTDVWIPASWSDQQEQEFLQWLQQRS